MFKKLFIIAFLLLLSLVLIAPSFLDASNKQVLQMPATTQITWPPSPLGTTIGPNTLFHEFMRYLYEWGIALGGIFVFVMLTIAGIEYLTSAGDAGKMTNALKRIKSAILGLILLLTSWLVLNTINPQLVQLRELPTLGGAGLFNGGLVVGPVGHGLPPCELIFIYPGKDFGGTPGAPVTFQAGKKIERIEGDTAIRNHSFPTWASARGLISLTEEEKKLNPEELERMGIVRFNDKGMKDGQGDYKEGGFCMIDLFFTTRPWYWFGADPCGGKLGRAQLPARDFTESMFRYERVTCIEAIRELPDITPVPAPVPGVPVPGVPVPGVPVPGVPVPGVPVPGAFEPVQKQCRVITGGVFGAKCEINETEEFTTRGRSCAQKPELEMNYFTIKGNKYRYTIISDILGRHENVQDIHTGLNYRINCRFALIYQLSTVSICCKI